MQRQASTSTLTQKLLLALASAATLAASGVIAGTPGHIDKRLDDVAGDVRELRKEVHDLTKTLIERK